MYGCSGAGRSLDIYPNIDKAWYVFFALTEALF